MITFVFPRVFAELRIYW